MATPFFIYWFAAAFLFRAAMYFIFDNEKSYTNNDNRVIVEKICMNCHEFLGQLVSYLHLLVLVNTWALKRFCLRHFYHSKSTRWLIYSYFIYPFMSNCFKWIDNIIIMHWCSLAQQNMMFILELKNVKW